MTKYEQVARTIEHSIVRDELRPGDQIGTHREFVDRLGVSRGTVTKALEVLERRGLVVTEQGRGTFVRATNRPTQGMLLQSFTESVTSTGQRPGARLVEITEITADSTDLYRYFSPGTPLIRSVRIRTIDDATVGLHRNLIQRRISKSARLVEALEEDPNTSIFGLMQQAGITITTADEEIDAAAATPIESKLLNVETGSPLLRVRRLSHDASGLLVDLVEALYRPDRYHIRVSTNL